MQHLASSTAAIEPPEDGFDAAHHLPLRHCVHRVDVEQPRSAVLVSLMYSCPRGSSQAYPAVQALRRSPMLTGGARMSTCTRTLR